MSILKTIEARSGAWAAVGRNATLALVGAAVVGSCWAAAATAEQASPDDPATQSLKQALKDRYPNTRFGDVRRTPVEGVWEVWMGTNVAYVTSDLRYFMFGVLYDMQTQRDLTNVRSGAAGRGGAVGGDAAQKDATFADLPLEMAIKTVRGSGARKLAVFSDPDCPYCKDLETSLAKLDNVTIYTFLYPLEGLHPGASKRAAAVWCAPDRTTAWTSLMLNGTQPAAGPACDAPIDATVELAQKLGIAGTPYLLFEGGGHAAGALDLRSLEQNLSSN